MSTQACANIYLNYLKNIRNKYCSHFLKKKPPISSNITQIRTSQSSSSHHHHEMKITCDYITMGRADAFDVFAYNAVAPFSSRALSLGESDVFIEPELSGRLNLRARVRARASVNLRLDDCAHARSRNYTLSEVGALFRMNDLPPARREIRATSRKSRGKLAGPSLRGWLRNFQSITAMAIKIIFSEMITWVWIAK